MLTRLVSRQVVDLGDSDVGVSRVLCYVDVEGSFWLGTSRGIWCSKALGFCKWLYQYLADAFAVIELTLLLLLEELLRWLKILDEDQHRCRSQSHRQSRLTCWPPGVLL